MDVGIHSGRSEDRPTSCKDPADGIPIERRDAVLYQALPTVPDTDDLEMVFFGATDNTTDHGIEAGAVAATGEDSHNAHPCSFIESEKTNALHE